MGEPTKKIREPKLEASKKFECNLPNEIWCGIFSYLDKKSLNNITNTCKLWFGMIRDNEKFSGYVKMKFTNLEDMSSKIADSKCLRERWPSMTVLEVSLGNQCLVAHYEKLAPQMTKIMKLEPLHFNEDEGGTGRMAPRQPGRTRNSLLHLEWKRREALIFYSNNVTMKIQDVIKKFKLEKFPILMKTQRHSSWRADSLRNWRNRKRKRQSIDASEATALWCYSMKINIRGAVVGKTGKTGGTGETSKTSETDETSEIGETSKTVVFSRLCPAPPNSPA